MKILLLGVFLVVLCPLLMGVGVEENQERGRANSETELQRISINIVRNYFNVDNDLPVMREIADHLSMLLRSARQQLAEEGIELDDKMLERNEQSVHGIILEAARNVLLNQQQHLLESQERIRSRFTKKHVVIITAATSLVTALIAALASIYGSSGSC